MYVQLFICFFVFSVSKFAQYDYFGGCKQGNLPCVESMYCNKNENGGCTNCTFARCMTIARDRYSYAFSYRGTGRKFCRMCDKKAFDNPVASDPNKYHWGIYRLQTRKSI